MRRVPPSYVSMRSLGPGRMPSAIKFLIAGNVALFLAQTFVAPVTDVLGLIPEHVVYDFQLWRLVTYMFLHGGLWHLLFNMLSLWMFGTELEGMWRTRYFLKFYFVTGVGAAILTVLFSLLPFSFAQDVFQANVIGASGAIYGLLLAFALYFPTREILMSFLFPIQAKYFVMIIGAIALFSSLDSRSGVANTTHLGGLLVAYLFLKSARIHPLLELNYRYVKWKLNRRRKFDVYSGGRADDWDRRVH